MSNPFFSPDGELFPSGALLWPVYPNWRVKTGKRRRSVRWSPHFPSFKSLSTAAELTRSRSGEFKSQLDAPFRAIKTQEEEKKNCHFSIKQARIKFRSPGSSSSFFPEQCACARVLRLSCSARLDSTREAASTIVRGIQRGENRRSSDASTSRRSGERRRRVCKGLGTEGGEGGRGLAI